jgi:hypothetical protein
VLSHTDAPIGTLRVKVIIEAKHKVFSLNQWKHTTAPKLLKSMCFSQDINLLKASDSSKKPFHGTKQGNHNATIEKIVVSATK